METPIVYTLCSGSSGNAVFLRFGDVRFLVDCGKNAKHLTELLASIGESPQQLSAIFITHEHIDHIRGLRVFAKRYRLPVYMTLASAQAAAQMPGFTEIDTLCVREGPFTEDVCGVRVTAVSVPHDSAACVAYFFSAPCGKIGVATDIGYLTNRLVARLCECDGVVLEANYDPDLLENGPYPYLLKQRIRSDGGHLSNPECARCALALAKAGVKSILLAHLSAENNTPELAYQTVFTKLATELCEANCHICVAQRHTATRMQFAAAPVPNALSGEAIVC